MKLPVTDLILDLNGKPIVQEIDGANTELTLGTLCKAALLNPVPGDDKLDGDERFQMGNIAKKIHDAILAGQPADLTVKEAAIVRARIGKIASTWALRQAWEMIDSTAN